jgi:hypothetical protein
MGAFWAPIRLLAHCGAQNRPVAANGAHSYFRKYLKINRLHARDFSAG